MAQKGLKADQGGVRACLEIAYYDTELEQLFAQLNTVAKNCARENRTAGQLIQRRSSFLTRAIDNLFQVKPDKTNLYQADGKTTGFDSTRHLIST